MPGRIELNFTLGTSQRGAGKLLRQGATMHMLVLGDFSGRRNRGSESAADLATRPIMRIDPDHLATVLRNMSPSLALGTGEGTVTGLPVKFDTLDDFHPDHLYRALAPFQSLRESRDRLVDGATFEAEAARLMQEPPAAAHDGDLLQRLIGAPREAAASTRPSVVDTLIHRLVAPHIKAGPTRSPAPFLAALDASSTELMRTLLHDRDFQALEAIWRGVAGLIESLELGEQLELSILDVTRNELLADLEACGGDVLRSSICRRLAQAGADASPWSLLIGHYSFGADPNDVALMEFLAVIAAHTGAPMLAAAEPALVGCQRMDSETEPGSWAFDDQEVERRWIALRRSAVAPWLGLALPRILLRLPYGTKTDPIDAFTFEEMAGPGDHEAYLWGNPALACAKAIARAFLDDGPDAPAAGPLDIEDLPAHVPDQDGERRLQPCAEVLLPIRVAEELLRRGMSPLLSYGNRNAVRMLRAQSIAEPPTPLTGLE